MKGTLCNDANDAQRVWAVSLISSAALIKQQRGQMHAMDILKLQPDHEMRCKSSQRENLHPFSNAVLQSSAPCSLVVQSDSHTVKIIPKKNSHHSSHQRATKNAPGTPQRFHWETSFCTIPISYCIFLRLFLPVSYPKLQAHYVNILVLDLAIACLFVSCTVRCRRCGQVKPRRMSHLLWHGPLEPFRLAEWIKHFTVLLQCITYIGMFVFEIYLEE